MWMSEAAEVKRKYQTMAADAKLKHANQTRNHNRQPGALPKKVFKPLVMVGDDVVHSIKQKR
jgi:hypothetical protein